MTQTSTNPYPHVEPPDGGVIVDDWQVPGTPDAYRNILGTNRTIIADSLCDGVGPHEVTVWNHIVQFPDGSFDLEGRIEKPGISVDIEWENGLSSVQARELAAVLIEAADEIDRWVTR
ncbi:MAG: hypothetical protein QOE41_1535 [Mycobacterium sp.]|jgi:hypothetical protein|nr:hypothetical protein [Mycobacterium sp.]MDT5132224.1 hypothetical protein [Mycobacterium sp.]